LEVVAGNFGGMVGASLLVIIILGGVGGVLRVLVNTAFGVPMFVRGAHGFGLIRLQWRGILVNSLWNLVMGGPLLGGLYNYYLKLIRGQTDHDRRRVRRVQRRICSAGNGAHRQRLSHRPWIALLLHPRHLSGRGMEVHAAAGDRQAARVLGRDGAEPENGDAPMVESVCPDSVGGN